tara:strand:- start:1340 stop:2152 length:813 start_codon:yes stop_codon:yes gene_type:complete
MNTNMKVKNSTESILCRLCSGGLDLRFSARVLDKYDVQYFKCNNCQSLQTETPFWLNEAYEESNLTNLDTGVAQRNLSNLAASFLVSKLFTLTNAIDFGGGDGLLCRLMRDYSINCFVLDKFASPTYAQGFDQPDFVEPDLLVAFEVLEHLGCPNSDLDLIFRFDPKVLLFSTAIYSNESHNWWYLSAETGQHVFFYSAEAFRIIAERYGYESVISGSYILLAKPNLLNGIKKLLVKVLLNKYFVRIFRSIIFILPTRGVWLDHESKLKN